MISVVFDMDGVLFDTQKIYLKAWYETAELLDIGDIDEPAHMCIGTNRNDQRAILDKYYNGKFPYDEFCRVKDGIFEKHLEAGVPLKESVVDMLRFLKGAGAKVAIASSSRVPMIQHHIEETGIAQYFDKIIGGDMVEHSKPDPEIYIRACELLGEKPEACYAVEDSYNGIRSAAAAGMKTIMIPDVLPPTEEMEELTYMIFPAMKDFMIYLKEKDSE